MEISSDRDLSRSNSEKLQDLLAVLFDKVLEAFAQIDPFSKETSPTFFVIYAHDVPDAGSADASLVRQLVAAFKKVRAKVISDRSLTLDWSTRENAIRDILANQLCLLPRNNKIEDTHNINSVDRVILCCSEVLQSYYGDARMKPYIEALKNDYPNGHFENTDEVKERIESIVKAYCDKEGFHHVLTELAFLEIRHRQERRDHGIIPIVLNGDGIKSLPFFDDGISLWLKHQYSESMLHSSQGLHRLFFNLLRQIYEDQHTHIDKFEECYKRCVKMLSAGIVSLSKKEFESFVSDEVISTLDQMIQHRAATYRNAPKAKSFNVTFDLTGIPKTNRFIGRNEDLALMEKQLILHEESNRRRICIIQGPGGMGKTQLAIEYARTHKAHYTAFFWLDGNTEESLIRSILLLTARLPKNQIAALNFQETKGLEESKKSAQEVLEWFAIEGNTRWLLVYDNIDKTSYGDEVITDAIPSYNIEEYLPKGDTGSIIVTTRLQKLHDLGSGSVYLRKLNDEESLLILREHAGRELRRGNSLTSSRKFDISDWDPDAVSLVRRVGHLPLALVFAGSYLKRTSIADYLELYQKSWAQLHKTMKSRTDYPQRNILTTWQISYDEVALKDTGAAKLLQLWGYLDSQNLWFQLLQWKGGFKRNAPSWLQEMTTSKIDFFEKINLLLDYSLIERNDHNDSFSMHAVVHDWIREVVNNDDKGKDLFQVAITTVGLSVLRDYERDAWFINNQLLLHINRCLEFWSEIWETQTTQYENVYLVALSNIGNTYRSQGHLVKADLVLHRALQGSMALGSDHMLTLSTMIILGLLYIDQGKLVEAEQMYQRTLQDCEKTLGLRHILTLSTINNLGILYYKQSKMVEAEQMFQQVLQGYEKALGLKHILTLRTTNNLGMLYFKQSKLVEAEQMYQRALQGYEKALGLKNIFTLDIMNNLGSLYFEQNKLVEAEQMYQRALQGYEKALGPEHILTLGITHNLGMLYFEQNKLAEAEQMYQRSLQYRERVSSTSNSTTYIPTLDAI